MRFYLLLGLSLLADGMLLDSDIDTADTAGNPGHRDPETVITVNVHVPGNASAEEPQTIPRNREAAREIAEELQQRDKAVAKEATTAKQEIPPESEGPQCPRSDEGAKSQRAKALVELFESAKALGFEWRSKENAKLTDAKTLKDKMAEERKNAKEQFGEKVIKDALWLIPDVIQRLYTGTNFDFTNKNNDDFHENGTVWKHFEHQLYRYPRRPLTPENIAAAAWVSGEALADRIVVKQPFCFSDFVSFVPITKCKNDGGGGLGQLASSQLVDNGLELEFERMKGNAYVKALLVRPEFHDAVWEWAQSEKSFIDKMYGIEELRGISWTIPPAIKEDFDAREFDWTADEKTTLDDYYHEPAGEPRYIYKHFYNQLMRIPTREKLTPWNIIQIALDIGQGMANGVVTEPYCLKDFTVDPSHP